jgi:hypothetical protein
VGGGGRALSGRSQGGNLLPSKERLYAKIGLLFWSQINFAGLELEPQIRYFVIVIICFVYYI